MTVLNAVALQNQRREGSAEVKATAAGGVCTARTSRCATATSYRHELRPCCRAHLINLVRSTVALLEKHGVRYWADYGTLLGAVRNPLTTWADYPWLPQEDRPEGPLAPGIIPHDKDADFGVMWLDWTKLMRVRADLERQGFHVVVWPHFCMVKVRLSAANHTALDLFSWRPRPNGEHFRVRYIQVDAFKGRDIPSGMLLPLGRVDWEGLILAAPVNPEAFCAFRYGSNWRTPIAANHDGVRRS